MRPAAGLMRVRAARRRVGHLLRAVRVLATHTAPRSWCRRAGCTEWSGTSRIVRAAESASEKTGSVPAGWLASGTRTVLQLPPPFASEGLPAVHRWMLTHHIASTLVPALCPRCAHRLHPRASLRTPLTHPRQRLQPALARPPCAQSASHRKALHPPQPPPCPRTARCTPRARRRRARRRQQGARPPT
jgi:hypothetical protein